MTRFYHRIAPLILRSHEAKVNSTLNAPEICLLLTVFGQVYTISSTCENASPTFPFDPRNPALVIDRAGRVPSVDQVMAEERAAAFTRRSIKTSAKLEGLKLAVSMMDLTTLEGNDTPGKIAFLCRKAMQPLDPRYQVPSCAAVCVYPNLVRIAKKFLRHSSVKVASVATAFPAGLMPTQN